MVQKSSQPTTVRRIFRTILQRVSYNFRRMDINRVYPFPMPSPAPKKSGRIRGFSRDNDGTIILYDGTIVLGAKRGIGEIPMISTMEVVAEVAWKSNQNFW